jgi:molybdopterin/thiamine biosynthesis adenylyltransferase
MNDRFIRNYGAINPEEQKQLCTSQVFVAGCGGLGGYVLEHLARMGVGQIVCADNGQFEMSDLNRQILSESANLGRKKTICAQERLKRIWPEIKIRAVHVRIDENSLPDLIQGCDLVMDALDNIETRKMLFYASKLRGIPVIHAAVNGWWVQAAFVPPDSSLIEVLYSGKVTPLEPLSVMSFAPGMGAAMQAALAARYLTGQPCDSDLHICDMRTMEFTRVQLENR